MRAALIAFFLGILLGTGVTYKLTAGDKAQAKATVLEEVVNETTHAVSKAQTTSVALQTTVDHITLDTHTFKGKVARHVPVRTADRSSDPVGGPGLRIREAAPPLAEPEIHLAHGGDRLRVGAVCLLDAARAGEDPDRAAQRCDEAGDAPSAIGVSELIDADLDAVGAYNALMHQHNTLIDFVEDLQRKTQE